MWKFTRIAVLCSTVVLLAGVAAAEDKPAAATPALAVPVKGVTKENAGKVTEALKSMERASYRCPSCGLGSSEKGDCLDCEEPLKLEKTSGPLLSDVVVDVAKGSVTFGIKAADGVHLSEIEAAMQPSEVTVDVSKLAVPGFTRLLVGEVDSAEGVAAVQKAFADAKLYEKVTVVLDEENLRAVVTVGAAKGPAPTVGALNEILKKAGDTSIDDVFWTAPCAACSAKGAKHAGCPACWEKRP